MSQSVFIQGKHLMPVAWPQCYYWNWLGKSNNYNCTMPHEGLFEVKINACVVLYLRHICNTCLLSPQGVDMWCTSCLLLRCPRRHSETGSDYLTEQSCTRCSLIKSVLLRFVFLDIICSINTISMCHVWCMYWLYKLWAVDNNKNILWNCVTF